MYKIYKITNKEHPSEIYVGSSKQTLEKRFRGHVTDKRSSVYPYIQRDGKENFEITAIDYASTKEETLEKEEFWTIFLKEQGYFLYNKSYGSKLSDEAKRKISIKTKARMKDINNNPFHIKPLRGENHPWFNRHHSKKTKKLISEKIKERFKDPTKNPMYGKHHTEKTKQKLRKKNGKAVRCIENNKIYESCTVAAKDLNCSASEVAKVARGKLKHTKGFHFEYI